MTRIARDGKEPPTGRQDARSPSAPTNLAARMGRWSAQHRKKAIWGWLAFVVVAFMLGSALGTETQDAAQGGVGESGRAETTLENAFPKHVVEQVLIQSDSVKATDLSQADDRPLPRGLGRSKLIRRSQRGDSVCPSPF
jgi:hypothetical protein